MSSPFYQPARQGFSSSQNMQQPQGGFGGGFGGFQPQQQGFGGGGNFDFGGSQGFGGFQQQFNPYQGGYGGGQGFGGFGGFQPQQQFNSFQGGFGGGFGGGYNPMFGGVGGLGFNPMMGQGFGMPMQGFNPYQQQMQQNPYQQQFIPSQQHVQFQHGQHQVSPYQQQQNSFQTQDAELTSQMQNMPEYQALQNAQKAFEGSEAYQALQNANRAMESSDVYKNINQRRQMLNQQMNASDDKRMRQAVMPRDIQTGQPMYGGLGGLGFNPMMGPQFGMPMGQRAQLLQEQKQFGYGQDMPQMQPKEDLSFEAFKSSQPKSDPSFQQNHAYNPIELQYRSWLNKKITPDGNRQLLPGESPRQITSQADVNSIYDRYLESRRPNAQMSAQLAAAQDAQMRAVMGI